MSLKLWERYGLLSPKYRKDVSQLVKKYYKKFPNLERPVIRRMIRVENENLFGEKCVSRATNLKALDRRLREHFSGLTNSPTNRKKVDITSSEDLEKSIKIEEADHEDVDECIKAISKELRDGNKDILSSRVDQLRQLSERKRVAHFPRVLSQINECLKNPMFVHDFETFKNLVKTLSHILFFEENYKLEKWDEIIAVIKNKISLKVIPIVMENPEFPDFDAVTFLGLSGRKEAVEALFEKFKSNPSAAIPRTDTALALARLYPEHKRLINQRLDALLTDENKVLVELAKKLRREILRQRSILDG